MLVPYQQAAFPSCHGSADAFYRVESPSRKEMSALLAAEILAMYESDIDPSFLICRYAVLQAANIDVDEGRSVDHERGLNHNLSIFYDSTRS